eukprot:10791758-Alexandrium_andersonii.AAC.1
MGCVPGGGHRRRRQPAPATAKGGLPPGPRRSQRGPVGQPAIACSSAPPLQLPAARPPPGSRRSQR